MRLSLPLPLWQILLAKDIAYLAVLGILAAPLSGAAGLTSGLVALAIGRYSSVRRGSPQYRWRFTGGRVIVGVPQSILGFGLASNQHGESHWPLLRLLVAHDLYTGLALRPQWGPVNGSEAVSEQSLLEKALDRLPKLAAVVGDGNFGIFSVAYAADQDDHPVVLRLTAVRARSLAGGPLQDGTDRRIQWRPSREDRRRHPEFPVDAVVSGRLIVRQVQPSNGAAPFLLALFTTLEDSAEEVVELYGKRWNIEVDLRTLKGTLRLEELACTSVAMVAKEIDVAMLAYNLCVA